MILSILLLLATSLTTFFFGSIGFKTFYRNRELAIQRYEGKVISKEQLNSHGISIFLLSLRFIILLVAFLYFNIHALHVEELRISATMFLGLFPVQVLLAFRKADKMDQINTEEDYKKAQKKLYTMKRHTVSQKILSVAMVAYYAYAYYVIVF